jgi:hypothetical protein
LGLLGDGWQAMGARSAVEEDDLSNGEKRRNASQRVRRTRQERQAELLETEGGRAALAQNVGHARDAYRRALEIDAGFAPALRGLGECADLAGEPRAAAQAYVEYLKAAPDADDRAVVLERLRALRDVLRSEGTNDVVKAQ